MQAVLTLLISYIAPVTAVGTAVTVLFTAARFYKWVRETL